MLAEILLTGLVGVAIVVIIFMTFFNTNVSDTHTKKKDKKKRKKKPKQKNKSNKSGGKKQTWMKTKNAAKNKPKIKLSDDENLVSVFRGHTGDITGVSWHQSQKILFSSSKDKNIYVWERPTNPQITDSFIGSVKSEDNGYYSALNTIITPTPHNNIHNDDDDDEKKANKKANKKAKKAKGNINPLTKYNHLSNSVFASTNGCFGLNSYNVKYAATSPKIRLQITSNIQTEFMKEDVKCIATHATNAVLCFIAVSGTHNTKIYFYDMKKKQRESKNKKIKLGVAPQNKGELRKVRENVDKAMEIIDAGHFVNYELGISRDGNWLSIGTFKKDIRLWKINYIKPGKRDIIQEMRFGGTTLLCSIINAHNKSITCITFSCNSQYMISASKDGYIKVWDIVNCDYARGNKPQMVLQKDLGIGSIEKVIISYQYDIIAVLNEKKQIIYIYQIKYGKKKIKLHCKFQNVLCQKDTNGQINHITFSPDSQYIAVGANDFDVRVYKIPAHTKSSK